MSIQFSYVTMRALLQVSYKNALHKMTLDLVQNVDGDRVEHVVNDDS